MRARRFAAIVLVFLFQSIVLAQPYSIRINHNSNLRASHSLRSRVVETAPAGTTLAVVGRNNRWLRISRDGKDVWLADWVDYTRVEDGAPPQTQATAAIDNCCFVDRQCDSDREWSDGYWAFQRGQCAAPAQVSPQLVGADAAIADNCCFTGWQCRTDAEWARGFYAYQNNQCKHPGIALEGSPGFILQVEQALDLLQSLSPKWYRYVITGLDRVRQTPRSIHGLDVGSRVFDLSYTDDLARDHGFHEYTIYMSAVLIHEACHVFRYEAGLDPGGLEGERACVEMELAALLEYAPGSREVHYRRRILANIHRPECQWWQGEYRACYD